MGHPEDLSEGQSFDLGEYPLTPEEVISFASEWALQPFHLEGSGGT